MFSMGYAVGDLAHKASYTIPFAKLFDGAFTEATMKALSGNAQHMPSITAFIMYGISCFTFEDKEKGTFPMSSLSSPQIDAFYESDGIFSEAHESDCVSPESDDELSLQ